MVSIHCGSRGLGHQIGTEFLKRMSIAAPQYGSTLPFQIPLGALLPRRVENLLPACKNLGVTHLTNGCYRLHPVEWNVGEAVGALVAFCTRQKQIPRAVRRQSKLLADFQKLLIKDGVRLEWPAESGAI